MEIPANPIAARVQQAGQAHIYEWWRELSAEQQLALQRQAGSIDFDALATALQAYRQASQADFSGLAPERGAELDINQAAQARTAGKQALRNGKVCAVVLAGGLGTRLGFGAPKGMVPIGPVTRKSLFQWFAEKIIFINRWAGASGFFPWAIMTSAATHDPTVAFFRDHAFFGLPEKGVHFIQQGALPAVDLHGKILMDAQGHICENPDGHGGLVGALGSSGLLEKLSRLGVEQLFIHNIDNSLVRLCDPVFLGHHLLTGADFSCKSVRKRAADETLATIARQDGSLRLVEYSDVPAYVASLRDGDGRLVYASGSINTFFVRVDFIQRLVRERAPFPLHATLKKIDCIDSSGSLIQAQAPNGLRFEKKIFDALLYTRKASVLCADRADEFSPLKNQQGLESPATVFHDLQAMFKRWILGSGIPLPESGLEAVEISPLFAVDELSFQEKIAQMGRAAFVELLERQIAETGRISL